MLQSDQGGEDGGNDFHAGSVRDGGAVGKGWGTGNVVLGGRKD